MASPPITQFGPDLPLDRLPAAFRACLAPGLSPGERAACDGVVGSAASGVGYCAAEPYSRMTYCACVNSPIPCPMVAAAACTNSAYAYIPAAMAPPAGRAYAACRGQPICVNIVAIGGSQNVTPGITQQCGVFQNVSNVVLANPILAALALVLLLTFVALLFASVDPEPPAAGSAAGPAAGPAA